MLIVSAEAPSTSTSRSSLRVVSEPPLEKSKPVNVAPVYVPLVAWHSVPVPHVAGQTIDSSVPIGQPALTVARSVEQLTEVPPIEPAATTAAQPPSGAKKSVGSSRQAAAMSQLAPMSPGAPGVIRVFGFVPAWRCTFRGCVSSRSV